MSAPLSRAAYAELMRVARRHARRANEAEDLLQDALLAALVEGRPADMTAGAWLGGVMRNKARMAARGELRRRRRDTAWHDVDAGQPAGSTSFARPPALPSALRAVLLLALTGHSRAEIRHLLRLSDDALRQRILLLRRRLAGGGQERPHEPLLAGALAFGSLRRGLLPAVKRFGHFGTHDPDGHAIVVNFSSTRSHESEGCGNRRA